MKEKLKRNFWHSSEIECMLSLIKEVKMQGSTATTHFTFVQIANKMKKRGFSNKSPTQIRRKWFQMKSAYLCYKKGNTERLMLIPERFRGVIAQYVENDGKPDNHSQIEVQVPARKKSPEKDKQPETLIEKFLSQTKQHSILLNNEFDILQNSLMQYEQKCQTIRDNNLIKYLYLNKLQKN